jgi:hypothetical protein
MLDTNERLRSEWSLLEQQWHASRRDWRDVVAVRFEREFWSQWEAEVPVLIRELADLEESLERALRALS